MWLMSDDWNYNVSRYWKIRRFAGFDVSEEYPVSMKFLFLKFIEYILTLFFIFVSQSNFRKILIQLLFDSWAKSWFAQKLKCFKITLMKTSIAVEKELKIVTSLKIFLLIDIIDLFSESIWFVKQTIKTF